METIQTMNIPGMGTFKVDGFLFCNPVRHYIVSNGFDAYFVTIWSTGAFEVVDLGVNDITPYLVGDEGGIVVKRAA